MYICISFPICDLQPIRVEFNNLRSYEHKDMDVSVLQMRIHTDNKNIVIHISTCLQVIKNALDNFILYLRRVYN